MYNNQDYLKDIFRYWANVPQELHDVLLDPQTSGNLLLSMPEKDAKEYLYRMECYTPWTRIIGEVTNKKDFSINII